MGEWTATLLVLALVVAASVVAVGPVGGGVAQQDGQLRIFSPRGVYFAGQEVDVSGQAAFGIDDVAVYVREQGDWQLADVDEDGEVTDDDVVGVDEDGAWIERSVTLSVASPLLDLPGDYHFGVVDAQDVRLGNGTLPRTLTPGEFVGSTSTQVPLRVRAPLLEGSFHTIRDQVATQDAEVEVSGIARGLDQVVVVVADNRGSVVTDVLPARGQYDVFSDDVSLVKPDGRDLAEGRLVGLIVSLCRDEVAGDGSLPGQPNASATGLTAYARSLGEQGLSQEQVVNQVYAETSEEPGSDDCVREQRFDYTGELTAVESIVPATFRDATGVNPIEVGETMVVRGTTNRKPDDTTVRVEVTEGPDAPRFPVAATDEWGFDGRWEVEIPVERVEPGEYTIRVTTGDVLVDVVRFQVLPRGERGPIDGNEQVSVACVPVADAR